MLPYLKACQVVLDSWHMHGIGSSHVTHPIADANTPLVCISVSLPCMQVKLQDMRAKLPDFVDPRPSEQEQEHADGDVQQQQQQADQHQQQQQAGTSQLPQQQQQQAGGFDDIDDDELLELQQAPMVRATAVAGFVAMISTVP